ncbi:MAG: hypothetical protein ACPIOQ_07910 [Promethearchaeia archaeon]
MSQVVRAPQRGGVGVLAVTVKSRRWEQHACLHTAGGFDDDVFVSGMVQHKDPFLGPCCRKRNRGRDPSRRSTIQVRLADNASADAQSRGPRVPAPVKNRDARGRAACLQPQRGSCA